MNENNAQRIAKRIARAGVASRRDAEKLILAGEVTLNGELVKSPAINVLGSDEITVKGQVLQAEEPVRLWRYHKPNGLVTTDRDEKGRDTIYDRLPDDLPRVMSIGRLDINHCRRRAFSGHAGWSRSPAGGECMAHYWIARRQKS